MSAFISSIGSRHSFQHEQFDLSSMKKQHKFEMATSNKFSELEFYHPSFWDNTHRPNIPKTTGCDSSQLMHYNQYSLNFTVNVSETENKL